MSNPFIILAVVSFLIAVNALYVAAEFSTVSAKRSRLAQLADGGYFNAKTIFAIVSNPHKLDAYIAACQVGITLSSLLLGYYGQAAILRWGAPYLRMIAPEHRAIIEPFLSLVILLILTVLQVILGELIPKNLGLQYPERLATWTALPMQWSLALFAPMIWLFNGSGRFLLRLFGANTATEHSHVHSPEEIVMLVEESSAGGVLDTEERRLLVNTLQMRNITARRVMVPRNRVLAAPVDMDPEALFIMLAESPYSRLPLYEGSIDKIVGMIHLKDLLQLRYQQHEGGADRPLHTVDVRAVMHPPLFVPDSISIEDVIAQMQRARNNVAIVVDEFGGTAGLLAIEDLVEQIVGEFQDEFDPEHPMIRLLGKNRVLVRGELRLDEVNELLGTMFSSDTVDTIGGLVSTAMGKIPSVGEETQVNGLQMRVEAMDANRVAEVSFPLSPEQIARLEQMQHE